MKVKDNSETPLPDLSQNDEDFLNDISSKSINELIEDNPKVLLFPPRLGKEDDIGGEHICKFDGEKISTNNIMGFVGKNDSQLTISSRFYHEKDDFFLHYMLQKTMALNIFDFDISKGKDNIYQFYIYLFPYYLKTALAQGLYKKYKKEQYNNSNVKGKIDIARNINKNIPFVGKVAYTIREHSYDNYIMQLIRHTIEHIKTTQSGECVLSADYATRQCVHQIVSATGTYRKSHKQLIINKNIQPFHHPYFTAYRDLQKICMLILRHNGLSFASEKDKVYGVLFDGAWLWEEYLFCSLKKLGFIHPKNKTKQDPVYLFKNNNTYPRYPRYPDYYHIKKSMVMDAKYKHMEKSTIDGDDMHQIISYMHILDMEIGSFIYPKETTANDIKTDTHDIGVLNGKGGMVQTYAFPIQTGLKEYGALKRRWRKLKHHLYKQLKRKKIY